MGDNRSKDEPRERAPDTPAAAEPKTPAPSPPPSRADLDDDEDGDIATPKRDRTGTDDEPL